MPDSSKQPDHNSEHFRFLVEQSTDMISRHSPGRDWTFLYVSPAVERILGYQAEELLGTRGYDLFHPDDADNLVNRAEPVRYRSGMYTNIYRYKHKQGHYLWLETTSRTLRDDQGIPVEIICVSRDVTEQTLAQQATQRLARVVEASSDMIMFCNRDSRLLTYMNEACHNTLGTIPAADVHLKSLFTADIYTNQLQEALDQATSQGNWYGSIPLQLNKLSRIAEIREIIAHRHISDASSVEYYTLIGRDITHRHQAEEEMKRQQLEMAHISRLLSVGEMASGLAHEVNQPLAAILNYCRGTMRRIEEGRFKSFTEIASSMELITRQAHRAADIIKRMRSFVKKTAYQRMTFAVHDSCHEVAGFLQREAEDHDISFEFQLCDAELKINADKVQIEQVLLNLMRNAIEAYDGCQNAHRVVIIASEKQSDQLCISVADHACGISPAVQEKLFEPFCTSKPAGLGMGLSISRTIIETHGGQLWADSSPEGSCFYIKLPVQN